MNQPTKLSQDARAIWDCSVDAVRAKSLVERQVQLISQVNTQHASNFLRVGGQMWDLDRFDRIIVVGAGKAATAMADGLVTSLQACLPIVGWINVPETEGDDPVGAIAGIHVHPARPPGVNEPTAAGVAGSEEMMRLLREAKSTDLCIALISGGGSALMPLPIEGITLDDKLQVTRLLSGSGANIGQLNTVRKRLSRVKGGGMLRGCGAGQLLTLVLSDVLGDPLDLIASGPTQVDTSTPADALDVLQQFDPQRVLPARVYEAIKHAQPKEVDVNVPTDTVVIGSNRVAVDAAEEHANQLRYQTTASSAGQCEGTAEAIGRDLARWVVETLNKIDDGTTTSGQVRISGGEPIVDLAPPESRGIGGRNQQLVLAAYKYLLDQNLTDAQWQRIVLLSGGTDGEDGPTDAAGAWLDAEVHHRATGLALYPFDYLDRCDAYNFFHQCGGLLVTGPTGTNVCDVRVTIVG